MMNININPIFMPHILYHFLRIKTRAFLYNIIDASENYSESYLLTVILFGGISLILLTLSTFVMRMIDKFFNKIIPTNLLFIVILGIGLVCIQFQKRNGFIFEIILNSWMLSSYIMLMSIRLISIERELTIMIILVIIGLIATFIGIITHNKIKTK